MTLINFDLKQVSDNIRFPYIITSNEMASSATPSYVLLLLLVLSVWFSCSSSEPLTEEWIHFTGYVKAYEKPYVNDSSTMIRRFNVFQV